MRLAVAVVGLGAVLAYAGAGRGEEEPLKQALALEGAIVKAVERAEGAVACILVSRSEAYRRWDKLDPQGGRREPGRLGGFQMPDGGPFRDAATTDLLKRLNLAATDVVPDAYGSGVVIDPSGLVLTNYHVVKDATKVFVRVPNKGGWYADIYAADERSDLALLKLIEMPEGPRLRPLPTLAMGDAGKLKKGQFVIALANPFAAGFRDGSPSVSWGVLSNIRRRVPGEPNDAERRRPRLHYYGFLLQTDLRLNLGCSGGALLDLKGNWVGLTTAQTALAAGESAGGYAIPLDDRMKRVIEVLRRGEEVEYGFLGITLDRAGKAGVEAVTNNGPAALGGLASGDRIVAINDFPVDDQDDLLLNVAAHLAGSEVRLTLQRYGEAQRNTTVVLAKSYWQANGPVIAARRPAPVHGLRVDYTSTLFRGVAGDVNGIPSGVVVRDVLPETPAARAGLRPESDIITAVNGTTVNKPSDFYAAARKSATVELTLAEGGRKVRLP